MVINRSTAPVSKSAISIISRRVHCFHLIGRPCRCCTCCLRRGIVSCGSNGYRFAVSRHVAKEINGCDNKGITCTTCQTGNGNSTLFCHEIAVKAITCIYNMISRYSDIIRSSNCDNCLNIGVAYQRSGTHYRCFGIHLCDTRCINAELTQTEEACVSSCAEAHITTYTANVSGFLCISSGTSYRSQCYPSCIISLICCRGSIYARLQDIICGILVTPKY